MENDFQYKDERVGAGEMAVVKTRTLAALPKDLSSVPQYPQGGS